jgi:hypothetical protein
MMPQQEDRRKLHIPDRRKHAYEDLVQRLDEHTDATNRRLHSFFAKALAIFTIIGITSALALFGFGLTLNNFRTIRKNFVRDTCVAQNKRHDRTIAKFKAATNRAVKRTPKFARAIRAGERDNLSIIDALAPKQDCVKLSKVSVGEAKPPPPVINTRRGH